MVRFLSSVILFWVCTISCFAQSGLHLRFVDNQIVLETPAQIYSMPWKTGVQTIREENNQWLVKLDAEKHMIDVFNYQPGLLLMIGKSVSLPAGGSTRLHIKYSEAEAKPHLVTTGQSVPIPRYHTLFSSEQQSIRQLVSTIDRTLQSFPVNLEVKPPEAGRVIGNGSYKENSYIHFNAVPSSEQYVFSHWEGAQWPKSHGTHMVTGPVRATAVFKSTALISIVDQDGQKVFTRRFPVGALTLQPPEVAEKVFVRWLEPSGKSSTLTLEVTSDKTLSAEYRSPAELMPIRIRLRTKPSSAGETFGSGTYRAGTRVQYYTTPVRSNYTFSHWEGADWKNPKGEFVAGEDLDATAVYKETHHVKILAGNETVVDRRVMVGEKLDFSSPVLEDHLFLGWTGDLNGKSAQDQITVTGDIWSEAKYEKLHLVKVTNNVNSDKVVLRQRKGESLEIHAPKIDGYTFSKWADGHKDPVRSLPVRGDREIRADYSKIHQLTLKVMPDDLEVKLTGGGTYSEGSEVEIIAPEIPGYSFLQWDGDLLGKASQDKVLVQGNMSGTAYYRKKDVEKAQLLQPYRINAGDRVTVSFQGTIQTSKVDWQGRAFVMPIGKIKVYELTRAEALTKINQSLAEVLGGDVRVNLQVDSVGASTASIEGGINRSDMLRLPLDQDISLGDLVIAAGGFSVNADRNNITIRGTDKVAFVRYDQAKDKKIEPGEEILVGFKGETNEIEKQTSQKISWEPMQLQP